MSRNLSNSTTHRESVRVGILVFALVVWAKEVPAGQTVYHSLTRESVNIEVASVGESLVTVDVRIYSSTGATAIVPTKIENAFAGARVERNALFAHGAFSLRRSS